MLKLILPFLLGFVFCTSTLFAGYDDGFIVVGEYEFGVEWFTYDPPLIVEGGGADVIDALNGSYLEVRYTSTPTGGDWHKGGIRDIVLNQGSELSYQDGVTDLISVYGNSNATLKGGSINLLRSFQSSDLIKHITFICDVDSVDYTGNLLTGDWLNGSSFSITLLDQSGYDSVYSNIEFVPEPATLVLLGFGGFLIRRKK